MGSSEERPDDPAQPGASYEQPSAAGDEQWASESLGVRVNEIVDAVEREAAKLRQEAEAEAGQIRHQAEQEARRYVDHAREQAESMVARRMERIHEVSDVLMARAEEVLERLDYAVPVKSGFENLVRALGETAERLASEDYSEFSQPSWEDVRAEVGPQQQYAPPAAGTPPPAPYPAQGVPPDSGYPPPPAAYAPPEGPPPAQPPAAPAAQQPAPAAGPSHPGAPGWENLDDAHRIAIQMAAAGSTRGEVEAHLAQAPAPTRASVLDEIFGQGTPAETRVPWASPRDA